MSLPDLITSNEYLQATGRDISVVSADDLAQINWAITAASDAIRGHADRDFVLSTAAVQGDRQYRYTGHETIEIDDATSISQVATLQTSFSSSRVLDITEWFAQPDSPSPVIDSIDLYTRFVTGISPAMGFNRNLDNYPFVPYPTVLVVTAVWGWPFIPQRVKQAAVWTVTDFLVQDPEFNAEAIATFSRSYTTGMSRFAPGAAIQALPDRAAALLDGYTRWVV